MNVLPDEVSDILLGDSGQGFYLDSYDKELELPDYYREMSNYVKPLLSEWPRSIHWGKLL